MTTKEDIQKYVESQKEIYGEEPIYEILVFSNPNKELIYPSGKHSGFPDTGHDFYIGYYHTIDDAIDAMHANACDMNEAGSYNAGFILCRFPGLYDGVSKSARMYFLYDQEKDGFFETEEPKIFGSTAY